MIILPNEVNVVVEFYWAEISTWTDITQYVVSDFEAEQGMVDESYDTRLADPATITFSLNNRVVIPLSVFHKGTLVRCQVTYDGRTRTKFLGPIDDIDFDPGTTGNVRIHITCTDWLGYAVNQLVRERPVEDNKRFDEGIRGLLTEAPIQPASTLIDDGITVFPSIYDQIDRNTTLYQELNRLIISEYGYGYMDRGGERFRVENRNARGSQHTIKTLPKSSDGSYLLKTDGDYLLKVDGDKILLNTTQEADFDTTVDPNLIQDIKVVHGKHILNEVEFIAFPKELDASVQTVFALEEPIFIPALSSITIEGYFSDPRGTGQISATDFVDPVATTDYLAFENSDGTGTDYTANITITPTYYADRVKFVINNISYGAWVTTLNLRAIGIYPDNPISVVKSDQSSKDTYGVQSLQIRQPYQRSIESGANEAERILDQEREAREVATLVSFVANATDLNMQAFLHLDIGDLIHIKTTKPAVDSNYYINGMRWRIDWATKVIYYTFILKEAPTFSMFAIEYSVNADSQNGVDYQRPPLLDNVNPCTFFMRIYQRNAATHNTPLMGKFSSAIRKILFLFDDGTLVWSQGFAPVIGQWITTSGIMNDYVDEWTSIGVTYDASSIANDPTFYVNGVVVANFEDGTPSGVTLDDSGIKFILNNGLYPGFEWAYESDIVAKDYRVYNRILTSGEMFALDANDDPDYNTLGLVFQAPFARNFRIDDYIDQVLTTEHKIFDRVNQAAGTVHYNDDSELNYIYGRDPDDTSF